MSGMKYWPKQKRCYLNFHSIDSFELIADPAGSEVKFDSRGDGLARYTIMNYRRIANSTNGYDYKVD